MFACVSALCPIAHPPSASRNSRMTQVTDHQRHLQKVAVCLFNKCLVITVERVLIINILCVVTANLVLSLISASL